MDAVRTIADPGIDKNPRVLESVILGSQEWLELRTRSIGGSDANLIAAYFMDVDYPYGNWAGAEIYKLWATKLGRIAVKASKDENTGDYADPKAHGVKTEDKAREWWSMETGEFAPPAFLVHETLDHLTASLDGFVPGQIALEVKCPTEPHDHQEAKEGKVPLKYWAQAQHNLYVAGTPLLHFVSFYKDEGVIVPVKRDVKFLLELREAEETFWDWVEQKVFPMPSGEIERTDKEWADAIDDYFKIQDAARDFEKAERAARLRIAKLMNHRKVTGAGARVTISVRPKTTVQAFEKQEYLNLLIQRA